MASQPERIILTYDDLQTMPEDGNRYELLEGDIEVTPSPSSLHQRLLTRLAIHLGHYVETNHLGTLIAAPMDVVLAPITVVQPDLLFVAREREEIIRPNFVAGPPDLVVEVLSPTTAERDRRAKRSLYARYAVPNYWIIDPVARILDGLALSSTGYDLTQHAGWNEAFFGQPFPDFEFRLSDIWP